MAKYKVRFGSTPKKKDQTVGPTNHAPRRSPVPTALARRLALAYYIEQLIEEGRLRDYAEAARVLGITRARMTQVMDLALLPVTDQNNLLAGETVGKPTL